MRYIKEVLNPFLIPIITVILKDQPTDLRPYLRHLLDNDTLQATNCDNPKCHHEVISSTLPYEYRLRLQQDLIQLYMYMVLILRELSRPISAMTISCHCEAAVRYQQKHMANGIHRVRILHRSFPKKWTKACESGLCS
jgi:hypothetical protein